MLQSTVNRCFRMTAPGASALATIRVAGPGVVAFLEKRFSKRVVAGRATHCELRDDTGVIDDPVVVLRDDHFAADLTLHGGAWIARCVLALAATEGFCESAVDVETVGSTDAATHFDHELLVSLSGARTELTARILLSQKAAWTKFAASTHDQETIARLLEDRSLVHLLSPPTVAIVGLPNAGKSTLANAFFGQKRSIVSPVAGTTRDWVGEEANLDGLIVRLIDTPGRRATPDAIERAAIEASDVPIASAHVVVVLLDASRDDTEQTALLVQHPNAIVVLNKADQRLADWTDDRIRTCNATLTCARSGDGLDVLIANLQAYFGVNVGSSLPRPWTQRQRTALRERRIGDVLSA